jgi:23S rRNA (guanine1835-N2)-methyltransferase
MNDTQLHIQNQQFSLKRFPSNPFDKSLRAWDAADEYIIDHVADTLNVSELVHIVIVNDSFGALTCAMARLAPQAKISVFTDSYMTKRGIAQNLQGSNLDKNNVLVHSSLELDNLSRQSVDVVLLKVPRTLSYLTYILHQLNDAFAVVDSLSQSPVFISGAMVKLVTSSAMKTFDAIVKNTSSSLARKKSRLLFAEFTSSQANKEASIAILPKHSSFIQTVQDSEIDLTLFNYPNVFCREQVDIGARYMLKNLPKMAKKNQLIIDLGCGNGILGTSLLLKHNNNSSKLIYIDESYMAIASAKATLANSDVNEDAKNSAEFFVGHCLEEFINTQSELGQSQRVDLVICNPPFHQQNTIVDDIAWQMFADAKKVLKVGGELRIVGNRHLDHRAKLSKLFGGCEIVDSDNKFVVLSSIRKAL